MDTRRLFAATGLFCDGLMFGMVDDDVLYLKADADTEAMFRTEGLAPFSYTRKGERATLTSLWRAPDHLLDDHDALRTWVRAAIGAARRKAGPRRRKASASRPPRRSADDGDGT